MFYLDLSQVVWCCLLDLAVALNGTWGHDINFLAPAPKAEWGSYNDWTIDCAVKLDVNIYLKSQTSHYLLQDILNLASQYVRQWRSVFFNFSNNKKLFFLFFYKVNNLFLHQSYLKSPLPVKLTW